MSTFVAGALLTVVNHGYLHRGRLGRAGEVVVNIVGADSPFEYAGGGAFVEVIDEVNLTILNGCVADALVGGYGNLLGEQRCGILKAELVVLLELSLLHIEGSEDTLLNLIPGEFEFLISSSAAYSVTVIL